MWLIGLFFLIGFEAIADTFSKEYSLRGDWKNWVFALGAYLVANIFWLYAIRKGSGLARGAALFSIGSATAAFLIGYFVYNEKLGMIESVGIFLGILAIILIFWSDIVILFK